MPTLHYLPLKTFQVKEIKISIGQLISLYQLDLRNKKLEGTILLNILNLSK